MKYALQIADWKGDSSNLWRMEVVSRPGWLSRLFGAKSQTRYWISDFGIFWYRVPDGHWNGMPFDNMMERFLQRQRILRKASE